MPWDVFIPKNPFSVHSRIIDNSNPIFFKKSDITSNPTKSKFCTTPTIGNLIPKVVFTATIHEAEQRSQNFGQVSNAYIRIVDEGSNTELIRYDLTEDYSIETAVVVGELYRHGAEWKFNAVGSGFSGGLFALCNNFGVNVG